MNDGQETIPGVGINPPAREPHYAGFNRRMIAATLDSLLVMMFASPLIDRALDVLHGPLAVDATQLMARIGAETDPQKLMELFHAGIVQSGLLLRWVENMLWQTAALAALNGICWYYWSSSPGKMALRIKIVDAKSLAPLSVKQIGLRLAGYGVSGAALFMGFFWIGLNKRRRGWHDYMAGTVAIVTPKAK